MGLVASLVLPDNRRQRLVEAALAPDVLLGMPQLTPFGLSETWLLKELAHRHWLMLGQGLGLNDADFRMPDGSAVYAAICASALQDADLAGIAANDILTIRSSLAAVSHTRMASSHRLSIDERSVGTLELISAFVHRAAGLRQGAIARVRLPGFETQAPSFPPSPLFERTGQVRRGDRVAAGLPPLNAGVLARYTFTPSQLQDFNGAGLFYFASYQAVIDRALESWFGPALPVQARETHYVGNIAAGDSVVVKLLEGPAMHLTIERQTGEPIAHQVLTLRDVQPRTPSTNPCAIEA